VKSRGRWPTGWDGHLLLLHHTEPQRREGLATWVRRGLALGAKIMYIEPPYEPPERSLPGLLQDQADAGAALARGQIQVVGASATAYDPAWQSRMAREALDQGFPSVRWSGEARTAWSVMPRGRHRDVECATDRLCRSDNVSVMCQYPADEPVETLTEICALHGAGLRERLFRAAPFDGGVTVSGEVDLSNHEILRSLLLAATAATDRDVFEVDVSGLQFLDARGARALLTSTVRYRDLGGRVRLRGPQPGVERLVQLLGVDRAVEVLTEEA
jgi:anti-anti-sigma factor